MGKTTFTVTVNGILHTRTSESRKYTHAILALRCIEKARSRAMGWTAEEQTDAEDAFRHEQELADGTWWSKSGHTCSGVGHDLEIHERGKATVAAGFEAFVAGLKADKIQRFEKDVAKGEYEWQAVAWAGSERLALAQAKTRLGRGYCKRVEVVPVGASVEL